MSGLLTFQISLSTRSNCISDCYITEAMTHCRCLPWDYPFTAEAINRTENIGTCDFFGSSCFNSFIENGMASGCQEKCDPGCNEIKYTTTIREEQINWESICSYDPKDTKNVLDMFEIEAFEYLFNTTYAGKNGIVRFQEALVDASDKKDFIDDYCKKKLMKDVAIVEVVMDSPTVIKYIQTKRVSWTDQISSVGTNLYEIVRLKHNIHLN